MKVLGLSTGRVNGNCEILLKEALMSIEEHSVKTEMIRAMELNVQPCRGCESCTLAETRGDEPKCTINDDVPWILEKILLEDAALIISVPTYHLRANAYFEIISERMLPLMLRHPEILKKTKVGGIIAVGGTEPEWTPLTLLLANIFLQHTRKLVDQMQVNFCGRPGSVLLHPEYIERARKLGKNIVNAISIPTEKVKYVGEEKETSCPYCHCDVLKVHTHLPEVYCPVCWVKGKIVIKNGKMTIDWDEESIKHSRFSEKSIINHLESIKKLQKFYQENYGKVKKILNKYITYNHVIKPK